MQIVECVPNFSEGRRQNVIEDIVNEVRKVKGVKLLDFAPDADHNRTVVTFVGEPQQVLEAAYRLTAKATELIDMNTHQGGHPRLGATDVIPIIPISGIKMKDCVELAKQLGQRIARELKIPVYLYEKAATCVERQNLAYIRKGEYEGFSDKITDAKWKPDYGEAKLHPQAGAVVVGARPALVAFNVNLGSNNLKIARKIGRLVRESSGGLVNVKAMGLRLEDRDIVQVSMNMTNYQKTALYRSFEMIKMEAARYGIPVVGSEIIGLVPMEALIDCASYYLQIEDFQIDQVLEYRLQQEALDE